MRTVAGALVLSAACAIHAGKAHAFTIAERGRVADCGIEVRHSHPSAKYAAEELAGYVKKMTGVDVSCAADGMRRRIVLDNGDASLGTDGFEISAEGDTLFVRGGVRGVIYGVYEMLERFGEVGWFASWHEIVPMLDVFSVPDGVRIRETPAFALREPFWYDPIRNNGFAVKIRKNHAGWSDIPEHMGGECRTGSKRLRGHTFEKLVPPERYFKDHPEYFSEIKGRRLGFHSQLCLTNPDVKRIAAEAVLAQMRAEPQANVFNVTANDWFDYCQCTNCSALAKEEGSQSGPYVHFLNYIAEATAKEFPGKFIRGSAYQWTRRPPKKLKALAKNIHFGIAPIECDFSMPIDKSPWKDNPVTVEDIKQWGKIAQGGLRIFDYSTAFVAYPHIYTNVRTFQDTFRFYRDNNVRYLINEGCFDGRGASFAELKAWISAKLMWNPDLPVEPLLDRFFEGFYGKAAPYARRFFDEAESYPRDRTRNPLKCLDESPANGFPDDAFFERGLKLWEQAEAAVCGDPAYLYNVRLGKLSVVYTILCRKCPPVRAVSLGGDEERLRGLARWLVDFVEPGNSQIAFRQHRDPRKSSQFLSWKRFADGNVRGNGSAVADEYVFEMIHPGKWVSVERDVGASGGTAAKIRPVFWGWCLQMVEGEVLADEKKRYRVRLRIRAEFRPGAERKGEAFSFGFAGKRLSAKERKTNSVRCKDVKEGYAWYDVCEWSPKNGRAGYFWAAMGKFDSQASIEHPAVSGVWVDQISFEPIGAAIREKANGAGAGKTKEETK